MVAFRKVVDRLQVNGQNVFYGDRVDHAGLLSSPFVREGSIATSRLWNSPRLSPGYRHTRLIGPLLIVEGDGFDDGTMRPAGSKRVDSDDHAALRVMVHCRGVFPSRNSGGAASWGVPPSDEQLLSCT
jgi:hypothetical protein